MGDTIGGQASRLERERADRDEVQDRLNHLVDHVVTHVLRLHNAYRRASATLPAVRLNPFVTPWILPIFFLLILVWICLPVA
jgi:hypothetical protein